MSGAHRGITLLLLEGGGQLLGIDAGGVRRIERAGEGVSVSAAELLGHRPAPEGRPRLVALLGPEGEVRVVADRVLGFVEVEAADLSPLPRSLRYLGTPGWVLGTTRREDRLVWLVDLARAAAAREGAGAR